MGHQSTPEFRTFHALRIKGFATVDVVAEMTSLESGHVEGHLADLQREGHAKFHESRSMWQLTAEGRAAHVERLEADLRDAPLESLAGLYTSFFGANGEFKEICTKWQLRDGEPNDHTDPVYDEQVIGQLAALHDATSPIVSQMGELLHRLGPYGPRLVGAYQQVVAGNTQLFTGVMCGSYHDIWMELHEDLILTQRIDRSEEGSF